MNNPLTPINRQLPEVTAKNEFKNGLEPKKIIEPIQITEKELATYNWVKLKLAHQATQCELTAHEFMAEDEKRVKRTLNAMYAIGIGGTAILWGIMYLIKH